MSKEGAENSYLSAFAFRAAIPGTLATALVLFAILKFGTNTDTPDIILFTAAGSISVGLMLYLYLFFMNRRRFRMLHQITKNITRKIFEDYDDVTIVRHDEIDLLIKRLILASKTVEKEILRLNKIENYRKEFIGDISHELKTPIFAIQGFIETLLDGAVHDDEVNELFLKKTMRNVNRLIYLTNDLMEISKLETGELKSNFTDVYLRDIVLDVVESLQYKAQKEDIEIRVKDFGKNIQVRADRNQIKQVLINLVENGMKYNTAGGYVEIGIRDNNPEPNKLILYVKDTGIGIDKRDIKRVTERFFRVDKSRSRDKGGTGLGLAIVKHIVEAHGENLIIESAPEQGSTFGFTLTKAGYFLE